MWTVRILMALLVTLPFWVDDLMPLILGLFFIPPMAAAVGVAHRASDHEYEDMDFVGPVIKAAFLESLWVFPMLAMAPSAAGKVELFGGLPLSLFLFVPVAALSLIGCYIGVFFCREGMSRQASGFGAGTITTVVLIPIIAGSWMSITELGYKFYWLPPTTLLLALIGARVSAQWAFGKTKIGGPFPVVLLGVLLVCWTFVASLLIGFSRHRGSGQLTACKSNLKNLGTAMEMYSTDWSGKYPPEADKVAQYLTPNYLKTIPVCPSAGTVTYTFELGPKARGNSSGFEDFYFIQCQGENHKAHELPPNYPQYDGVQGLIER